MKKVFSLFGTIALDGMTGVTKQLTGLDKMLKDTSKALMKTGKDIEKLGVTFSKQFTAPIAAAATAVTALAKTTGDYADRILDLTQITGMSTDSIQRWKYAVEQSGGNFDSFIGIVSKFTNKVPEIIKGGNASSKAFSMLGISLKDSSGNIKNMDALLPEMIDSLRGIEDVTARNALAQDLFGRSLEELAPILGMTSEELSSLMKEADDVGAVMSGDSLKAADELRRMFVQFQSVAASLGRDLAVSFVPLFRDTIFPLIKNSVVPAVKDLSEKIKSLGDWFNKLNPETRENVVKFTAMLAVIGPLLIGIGNLIKMVAGLRATVLLLNTALLANPFVLAATAAAALAVGLWATKDAFVGLNKEIEKGNVEKMKGNLEELIYELTRMNEAADPWESVEAFNAANERISILRKNLSDLGVYIEGDYTQMFIAAYDKLNEITGKAPVPPPQKSFGGGGGVDREEELKKEKKLYEQYEAIRKDAQDRDIEDAKARYEIKQKLNDQALAEDEAAADRMLALRNKAREDDLIADQQQADRMLEQQRNYLQRRQEAEAELTQGVLSLQGAVFDAFQAGINNRMQKIDESYSMERANIEMSATSEADKQAKIEALDEKTAKKKRELARKQAVLDKVTGIFSIGISTAQGIMKAFATLAYPLNIVAAALVGATGAIQTAIVASKPIPEAAEGMLVKKKSGGTLLIAGESTQDEAILPMKTGAEALAGSIVERIGSMSAGASSAVRGLLSGSKTAGSNGEVHLHVHGNLFTNNAGLKDLYRVLNEIGIKESTRLGAVI